jgi:hypothetical protein
VLSTLHMAVGIRGARRLHYAGLYAGHYVGLYVVLFAGRYVWCYAGRYVGSLWGVTRDFMCGVM